MFKWLRIVFALLLVSATAAYAALPGSHRILTPTLFGLSQIESGIFTDAPERSADFDQLYARASTRTAAFFGPMRSTPRIIICTTQDCADIFDLMPRGLTFGAHVILLGPKGVNEMILTHELAHIQLNSQMGIRDIFKQRIPAWFNEGLATFLSADTRLTAYQPKNAIWITQAQSFRDWGRLHQTYDWQDTYGAAQSMVADLHNKIGVDGLRMLIASAVAKGDFTPALSDAVGPDWP